MNHPSRKTRTSTGSVSGWVMMVAMIASVLVGATVIFGWLTHNKTLLQLHPTFAPMQINTALGFFLGGLALLGANLRIRPLSSICGGVVGLIGFLTLIEYVFGVNLGIDELLMKGYVDVKTSHPGRMAPNTALCFFFIGSALALPAIAPRFRHLERVVGSLGSLVLGLAVAVLLGYLMEIDTSYGWGNLTRMAVHTAAGFVALSVGSIALAWRLTPIGEEHTRLNWSSWLAALAVCTMAVSMWQALNVMESNGIQRETATALAIVKKEISWCIEPRARALGRMAKRWIANGTPDRAAGEADAVSYMADNEGCRAIAWVDSDDQPRWVIPKQKNQALLKLDASHMRERYAAFKRARRHRAVMTTRWYEAPQGGYHLAIIVPIYRADEFDGYILGVFESQTLLGKSLNNRGTVPGFNLMVLDGDKVLYQRGVIGSGSISSWAQENNHSVEGAEWRVRVAPDDEMLASHASPLPLIMLIGGLLLGVLPAGTIHLMNESRVRSIKLAEVNQQLSEEVAGRMEMERELRAKNLNLTRVNREIEQFVYTVSHDLKSPIVTQIGYIGCIREDLKNGDQEQVHDSIERLERATRRMQQCIDDLLELSRIGRVERQFESVDVKALIEDIRVDLSSALTQVNAQLTIESDLPTITADFQCVREVFENLINNAIKYGCQENGATITVGSEHHDEEIRLFVRDQGPGISPKYREKIFGLFQRLDADKCEGSGIGLSIVQRVMEMHDGRAWVESVEGQGATFWLSFPSSRLKANGNDPSAHHEQPLIDSIVSGKVA